MLLRFSLSKDALQSLSGKSPREQRAASEAFIAVWRELGVLVRADSLPEDDNIRSLISSAPPLIKKGIANLYKDSGRKIQIPARRVLLTECKTSSDVDSYKEELHVYLVDNGRGSEFQIEEDKTSHKGEHAESCIFQFLGNSSQLASLHAKRAGEVVEIGTDTAQLYLDYFKDTVSCARELTIVDRYCIGSHNDAKHASKKSGVENFLEWALRDNPLLNTTIICSEKKTDEKMISEFTSSLRTIRNQCRAPEVTIHILDDDLFKHEQHFRYVRLSQDVIDIDTGLKLFEGRVLDIADKIAHRHDSKYSAKKREKKLIKGSRAKREPITI